MMPVLILIPRPQHESGVAGCSGESVRSGEDPLVRLVFFCFVRSDLGVGAFTDCVGLAASCSSRTSAAAVLLDRLVKFFGSSKKAASGRTECSALTPTEVEAASELAEASRAAANLPPMISAALIFLGRYSVRGNSSDGWCERVSVWEERGELA